MVSTRPERPHRYWTCFSHHQNPESQESSRGPIWTQCRCSGSTSKITLHIGCFGSVSAAIQVSQSVLCAGRCSQCVSPGSSETAWLHLRLCTAPAGTGTGMCGGQGRGGILQNSQGSLVASSSISSSSSEDQLSNKQRDWLTSFAQSPSS